MTRIETKPGRRPLRSRAMALALTTALAITAVGAAAVVAAPSSACDPGDKLATVTAASVGFDLNGNGLVCSHTEHYHAPKKPGPPSTSVTYYDDAI